MSDPFQSKVETKLDLRLGEPEILQEYWKYAILPKSLNLGKDLKYQLNNGSTELIEQIYLTHALHKNVRNLDKYNVVVTAGATVGLWSVISALNGIPYIPAPYFARFDTMLSSISLNPNAKPYVLATSPNNPNGTLHHGYTTVKDSCYNWSTYYNLNEPGVPCSSPIQVFSLSKLSGHASSRLGWVLCQDVKMAEQIAQWNEYYSGGVSLESQDKGARVLDYLARTPEFFERYRSILSQRNKVLDSLMGRDKYSERGMFLYCKADLLPEVAGLPGEIFNDTPGKMRYNIACSEKKFNLLIKELKKVYK